MMESLADASVDHSLRPRYITLDSPVKLTSLAVRIKYARYAHEMCSVPLRTLR